MRPVIKAISLALAVWWIPVLNGVMLGFYSSVIGKNVRNSVLLALTGSLTATAVYFLIYYFGPKLPLIGEFPILLAISAFGTALAIYFSYFSSVRATKIRFTPEGLEIEFYAKNLQEVDEILTKELGECELEHVEALGEERIRVRKRCGDVTLEYEAVKEGKRVKVRSWLH
ncbi:MAG: hypothetical protein ACP5HQ_01325 [Thermoprotei archaeon]